MAGMARAIEANKKLAKNVQRKIWGMRNVRQRLVECIKTNMIQQQAVYRRYALDSMRKIDWKIKGWEKIYHANNNGTKALKCLY